MSVKKGEEIIDFVCKICKAKDIACNLCVFKKQMEGMVVVPREKWTEIRRIVDELEKEILNESYQSFLIRGIALMGLNHLRKAVEE